jgi:fatty acid synthase
MFLKIFFLTNIIFLGNLELTVIVTKGTGTFEVVEGGSAIVTGKIYIPEDIEKEMLDLPPPRVETTPLTPPPLSGKDVYKELRLRGYNYSGIFKAITELDSTGKCHN